jgi:hypothetical protein
VIFMSSPPIVGGHLKIARFLHTSKLVYLTSGVASGHSPFANASFSGFHLANGGARAGENR